jgi:hypothetical protein
MPYCGDVAEYECECECECESAATVLLAPAAIHAIAHATAMEADIIGVDFSGIIISFYANRYAITGGLGRGPMRLHGLCHRVHARL